MGETLSQTIVSRLQALADATRSRLLLVLERQELTVSEICAALQVPQSTASRHLKVLADEGWVVSRADGASNRYRMPLADLDATTRRLRLAVRDEAAAAPAAVRDAERLRGILAERRSSSEQFFDSAAGQWDRLRTELFGARTELLPLLGLLHAHWTVADLGCGTGQLSAAVAPFVARVVAVDGSPAMLRAARTRVGGLANVEVRRGELEALPLDDGEADLALLVLVLPYVADPARVLAEAARVIKPGGTLLVTDLMPHERAEYRQTLGHHWQGFAEDRMAGWMREAGLGDVRYRPAPLEPGAKGTRLFTAVGIRA